LTIYDQHKEWERLGLNFKILKSVCWETSLQLGVVCFKHPLLQIFEFTITKDRVDLHNKEFANKEKYRKEALKKKDYSRYIWLHERYYEVRAFNTIAPRLDDKTYWKLLAPVWLCSENGYQYRKLWHKLFSSDRGSREYLMEPEERDFLKSLPSRFTIYRGAVDDKGISWTLSEEKAEWFHARFPHVETKVFSRKILQENAVAYFDGRNEQEIIYLGFDRV